MSRSTFAELCGSIIFGLTRSVAEHFNRTEAEFNSESSSFSPVKSTGLEWNCHPVDELIYQEYGDREVASAEYLAFNNVQQARVINACSQEDTYSEDTPERRDVNFIQLFRKFAFQKHCTNAAWCLF